MARPGVRGTFSQPGPSRPAAAVRLARTLCVWSALSFPLQQHQSMLFPSFSSRSYLMNFLKALLTSAALFMSIPATADVSCRTDSLGTTRCSDGATYRTDSLGTTRDNNGNSWRTDSLGTTRGSDGSTYRTDSLGTTRDNKGNSWRTDSLGTTRGSNGTTCRTDSLGTTRCQ